MKIALYMNVDGSPCELVLPVRDRTDDYVQMSEAVDVDFTPLPGAKDAFALRKRAFVQKKIERLSGAA